MSELAREEILAVLEAWKKEFSKMQIWYEIDEEIYQAIRRLIENRPRMTKEFVEKWSEKIYDLIPEEDSPILDDGKYPGSNDPIREYLIAMLRELGHEMKEKEEKCRS